VAVLVSVLWGANPIAIKLGLADMPPLRLAALRFVIGLAVILAWAWFTGRLHVAVAPEEWRPLLVLGLLFSAQIATMNIGTGMTTAAHATVLLNMYAVHTVVLAHFLIPGDRLTARRLAGISIAYAGIVLLFARELARGTSTLAGDLVMFVSAFILAERTVYLARAVHRFDPVKLLLAQALLGIGLFSVGSAAFETAATRWTWRLAGSLVYQGALIAGFNFIVNLWLLKHYRASTLAAFFLTQPIFGVLAAAMFTGDPLTADVVLASVAVAVGIGLTSR
jgi:drug/metabolite transporter (DMT)-like permease